MQITNKADLPRHLYNLFTHNTYNKSGSRFDLSATTLIDAMQPKRLFKEHRDDVEEDAIKRIWAVLGTAVHLLLEMANSHDPAIVCEKRFIHELNGKKISAQIDVYNNELKSLHDLKVTSAWKVLYKDYGKWEAQMNIQAALARMSGWEVNDLFIDVLCRDFVLSKAREDNYPNIPIVSIPMPLWSEDKALAYLEERIKYHTAEEVVPCTDEDRWAKPAQFAVMKKGRKSALAVKGLTTKAKALSWAASHGHTGSNISIEERPATYTRCESFCNVSKWCPQFNPNSGA